VGWALRLHPRRWRQRYGGEVRDLVDEIVGSGETTSTRAVGGIVLPASREQFRALRRPRRAITVLVVAVAALAGVLAATTLGAKAPLPRPSASRLASETMFIAFMDPKATTPEISALARDLAGWEPKQVKSCRYVDKAQSFAEFKEKFRDDPGTLKGVILEMMPPSFRCTLAEAGGLPQVNRHLVAEPGIYFVRAGSLAAAPRA
jgi:cell division protein FtsX